MLEKRLRNCLACILSPSRWNWTRTTNGDRKEKRAGARQGVVTISCRPEELVRWTENIWQWIDEHFFNFNASRPSDCVCRPSSPHIAKFVARPVWPERWVKRRRAFADQPATAGLPSDFCVSWYRRDCDLRSYDTNMCRKCAHTCTGSTDTRGLTWPRLRSSRNIRFLVHHLASLPSAPFFVFDVPSEPHAHGCARLKIWNQCDQNGCYGRAPVYRTVAIRPEADQVAARPKVAPRARAEDRFEIASLDRVSSREHETLFGRNTGSRRDSLGPQSIPPRVGDRRVLLFTRGIYLVTQK